MKVRKALITAAAPDQHLLPLQQVVDRDGVNKTALQLLVEEAASAGIDEIGVVIHRGDEAAYRNAAGGEEGRITFLEQASPRGYGDALLQAREFLGQHPFLHLVGDHLYLSNTDRRCARQLIDVATQHECAVSAVQSTRESKLPYFGAIGGRIVPKHPGLYEVTTVLEKPTPTEAEQHLMIGGHRAGRYLCFFGMHILTATVMDLLAELVAQRSAGGKVQLSDALAELAKRERYLALETNGVRYNLGEKYGLLTAQLALALSGRDRDHILTDLVELLATGPTTTAADPS